MRRLLPFVVLAACGDDPTASVPPSLACDASPLSSPAGSVVSLGKADTLCISLAPGDYAVAYFDDRVVELAKGGAELPLPQPTIFGVSLRDVDRTQGIASLEPTRDAERVHSLPGEQPIPELVGRATSPECPYWDPLFCRVEPFAVGDTFTIRLQPNGEPIHVDVKQILGGFVFVERPTDRFASTYADQLSDAVALAETFTIPLLRDAFRDRRVETGVSPQMVVFIESGPLSTIFGSVAQDNPFRGGVVLRLGTPPEGADPPELLDLFSHELTHVWQWAFAFDGIADPGLFLPVWGVEGGASFVAQEAIRLALGLGRDATIGPAPRVGAGEQGLWQAVTAAEGRFMDGYTHAASFMRFLLYRTDLAGIPYAAALPEVLRGALEGWYGAIPSTEQNPGLLSRIEPLLGDLDPPVGLLDWAISAGVDDRFPDPWFQTPLLSESWRDGWTPHGSVSTAGRCCVSTNLGVGNVGYSIIEADVETRIQLATGLPEGVHWRVARFR